jgi:ABC-type multidrug transport system fused ATPase/permease subunit
VTPFTLSESPSPTEAMSEAIITALPPKIPTDEEEPTREVRLLVEEESKGKGTVGLGVYWFYISSGGGLVAVLLMIVSNVFLPSTWFFQNYTLGEWTSAVENNSSSKDKDLLMYIISVVLVLFATCFKVTYMALVSLRAARELHDKMTQRVLYAPMSWFDATPSGRLINRFSQDISTIDTSVMNRLGDFFECLVSSVQTILIIGVSLPLMLFCMAPVVLYFWYVSNQYLKISRDLKRLESVNKSPVFVLFSETLSGISTIRAFHDEERFFDTCCKYVDTMNRCHFYMWVSNRWLNCRTQIAGSMVGAFTALLVVWKADQIGSTLAGLALVYSMYFTQNLTFLARTHSDSQMNLNSVERVQEYCSIDQEKYQPNKLVGSTLSSSSPPPAPSNMTPTSSKHITHISEESSKLSPLSMLPRGRSSIPENWPQVGEIVFDGLSMR